MSARQKLAATVALAPILLVAAAGCGGRPDVVEQKAVAEDAYVYGFPMIANYKAMYQFSVDSGTSQYKGPFNRIVNDSQVFTPADSTVITPNSDTPYSMLEMDLRAEPIVFCVPAVDSGRYYSVQLIDMYTFNFGYVGSRATGNGAGCYMVAGPGYKGGTPAGVAKVFPSETEFALAIFRTQLFNAGDIANVVKIQAGYTARPLSGFLGQPAPAAAPPVAWPAFTEEAFKTDAFAFLNFVMQFAPTVSAEDSLRARFARIGIGAGKPYSFAALSKADQAAQGLGIKDAYASIQKARESLGESVNGWRVSTKSFGNRAFLNGDWLTRAAAALAGIYGNDAVEALYPMTFTDSTGKKLDASQGNYIITFPAGQLPPVNAFWSVTMYDGTSQLLVSNPVNRYLINSPMLPDLKKNADGSLTLYVQHASPGKGREANWLPAPNGTFYLVMRLYWPKDEALNGSWKPPAVVPVSK